jgi:hypothetical protein
MNLPLTGRLAGMMALALALTGCVDETISISVKSEAEARGALTRTVAASAYSGMKSGPEAALGSSFCNSQYGGVLVENANGSATCTITNEGKFADLQFDGSEVIHFDSAGAGLVRVSFPMNVVSKRSAMPMAEEDEAGPQFRARIAPQLAGHYLTLHVDGGMVLDTNMTPAMDGLSAEERISMIDMLSGTKFPDAFYAIVQVK